MRQAAAIDTSPKRHCMVGQYRFTEWATPLPAEEAVRQALATLAPQGFEIVDLHSRKNGVVSAQIRYSLIPSEILSWFEHFEKKGIPAVIVKKRNSDEYAVLREGVDHTVDDEDVPEILSKTDIFVLKACHGFKLRFEEY